MELSETQKAKHRFRRNKDILLIDRHGYKLPEDERHHLHKRQQENRNKSNTNTD